MPEIPKEITRSEQQEEDILPQSVAEILQDVEAPEVSPYVISFAKYNEKVCEVDLLNKNKPKLVIESLKKIGTKVRSTADFQRYSIGRIPVRYEGDYKKLFRGLGEGVDLRELKLQQSARIFYFDIESRRTLYIVAITNNHLETRKVKR